MEGIKLYNIVNREMVHMGGGLEAGQMSEFSEALEVKQPEDHI